MKTAAGFQFHFSSTNHVAGPTALQTGPRVNSREPRPTMDPRYPVKRHLGWRMAAMVAMLVACLFITGGLVFALKGAQRAMANQRRCPPSDNDDSLQAILKKMTKLSLPPPKTESWVTWFTFCTLAMVAVSVVVTMVVVLWLKNACIKAMIITRIRRSLGQAPEDSPPPFSPAFTSVVVHV
ncbi:unnamed protein product [Lota lota]